MQALSASPSFFSERNLGTKNRPLASLNLLETLNTHFQKT